jgi:hypothetical protein
MAFSRRTQSYVDALIQEGDEFDYAVWLKRVREEEKAAAADDLPVVSADTFLIKNKAPKSSVARPFATAAQDSEPSTRTSVKQTTVKHSPMYAVARAALKFRLSPSHPAKAQDPSLTLRISKVEAAWRAMKLQVRRNAIYRYLAAVFELVTACKGRRRTRELLRRTATLIGLPAGKNADPFAGVIRCTCDGNIDRKTISRWSRALRYVARRKSAEMRLKTFMKREGGVNACAQKYARVFGRGRV